MKNGTMFLSVRPRVPYRFFSPKCRHLKLASRYGVQQQLRPLWTSTIDTEPARHTDGGYVNMLTYPPSVFFSFDYHINTSFECKYNNHLGIRLMR
ncbi:MAG: hypothetical protein J1F16_10070 [Muribaculaceae bacterium]|nr:hypothetical protein [Muribaculaceae bacterium]